MSAHVSYQDVLYREPAVADMFARARRVQAKCEIMAEATVVETAVADLMEAIQGDDYEYIDDIAIEIARAGMRMRRRSRGLAGRVPERRPQPSIICPQCEFTVRHGTGEREVQQRPPAPSPKPERYQEFAAETTDVCGADSPASPTTDSQPRTDHDIKGNAENTPSRTLRTREEASPTCQPALAGPSRTLRTCEELQPNCQSALAGRKERRRLKAIERKRKKKQIKAARRELVEAVPGGT